MDTTKERRRGFALLTTQIAAAYLSNHPLALAELAGVISSVHGALRETTAMPAAKAESPLVPRVPVKRSVTPDYLVCLEDGMHARCSSGICAHVTTSHMKNSVSLLRPFDDPLPADVHDLDVITFLFFYHDTTYMDVDRAQMNRKLFAALKPGGVLVIADHAAKAGSDITVGKTLHRIDESTLRREVEAAGFKLIAEGDFWHHPEDLRDFPSVRPTGPVDEFVLKFQKPM